MRFKSDQPAKPSNLALQSRLSANCATHLSWHVRWLAKGVQQSGPEHRLRLLPPRRRGLSPRPRWTASPSHRRRLGCRWFGMCSPRLAAARARIDGRLDPIGPLPRSRTPTDLLRRPVQPVQVERGVSAARLQGHLVPQSQSPDAATPSVQAWLSPHRTPPPIVDKPRPVDEGR